MVARGAEAARAACLVCETDVQRLGGPAGERVPRMTSGLVSQTCLGGPDSDRELHREERESRLG
eukprot:352534-Chlamydomonas_euryale.AAC.1